MTALRDIEAFMKNNVSKKLESSRIFNVNLFFFFFFCSNLKIEFEKKKLYTKIVFIARYFM